MKTIKKVRQTKVDASNKALWKIITTLQEEFTTLFRAAITSNILQSVPRKSVLLPTTFKCAHDAFSDSGVRMAPHLIADYTAASKQIADIIAKNRMQDTEDRSYELIARNAEKTAQRAKKKWDKAEKTVAVASKKIQATAATKMGPGAKVSAGNAKQKKLFAKAQKAAADAKAAFNQASKTAADASNKAVVALNIQLDIVQRWQGVIAKMKPAASCTRNDVAFPTHTDNCQLYLAPCAKCKDSKCKCMYAM